VRPGVLRALAALLRQRGAEVGRGPARDGVGDALGVEVGDQRGDRALVGRADGARRAQVGPRAGERGEHRVARGALALAGPRDRLGRAAELALELRSLGRPHGLGLEDAAREPLWQVGPGARPAGRARRWRHGAPRRWRDDLER
jgi:hypothetical protein